MRKEEEKVEIFRQGEGILAFVLLSFLLHSSFFFLVVGRSSPENPNPPIRFSSNEDQLKLNGLTCIQCGLSRSGQVDLYQAWVGLI